MKISVERSGGFTGIPVTTQVDGNQLDPNDLQDLQTLLDTAQFFELPAQIKKTGTGADRFQYVISVEDGNQHHSVAGVEGDFPASLQTLILRISALARSRNK